MNDILLTIGVALFSGLAVFLFGYHRAGKAHKAEETEQRLEDIKEAQEVRNEVEALDDNGLAARASRWLRKHDN